MWRVTTYCMVLSRSLLFFAMLRSVNALSSSTYCVIFLPLCKF